MAETGEKGYLTLFHPRRTHLSEIPNCRLISAAPLLWPRRMHCLIVSMTLRDKNMFRPVLSCNFACSLRRFANSSADLDWNSCFRDCGPTYGSISKDMEKTIWYHHVPIALCLPTWGTCSKKGSSTTVEHMLLDIVSAS